MVHLHHHFNNPCLLGLKVTFCIQLRTPFNWLLMNLSLTELIIAASGNSILAFNSFHRRWTLTLVACKANAFGMTFLGIFITGVLRFIQSYFSVQESNLSCLWLFLLYRGT